MRASLVIIGGSATCLPLLAAAKRRGLETVVLDAIPTAVGMVHADHALQLDICDEDACVRAVAAYAPAGVLSVTDFGTVSMAAIAEAFGLAGPCRQSVLLCRDKIRMRSAWLQKGCDATRTLVAVTASEAASVVGEAGWDDTVFKPAQSSGGSRGVSIVRKTAEVEAAFRFAAAFDPKGRVLVEERHKGIEHSVELFVQDGAAHVLAISDKVKTPPPYRVDKSVDYPTTVTKEQQKRIEDSTAAAALALGLDETFVHIELCSTDKGVALFEASPRCGGGATASCVVPHVTGEDIPAAVVGLSLGERLDLRPPESPRGCSYRFLTPQPGVLDTVTGLDEVRHMSGILECDFYLGPGDSIPRVRTGQDRSGHLVAAGNTREQATALADRAESTITVTVKA